MELKHNLYLVTYFRPDTAGTNRFLALVKGLEKTEIKINVVFLMPNIKRDKYNEEITNVNYIYPWEKFKKFNLVLSSLLSLFSFLFSLNKHDTVIIFGLNDFLFIFRMIRKIQLYCEITEHPDISGIINGPLKKLRLQIFLKTLTKINGIFVISPSLKKYFVEGVGVNENRVHIINMLVDSTRFDNIQPSKISNNITYCGTISEYKDGISDLIKAFSIVNKKYHNMKLSIIGDFESIKTKERVHKLISDLNIDAYVEFMGVISTKKIPEILTDSKLLVLSRPKNKQSQYGFPTKLGEYLMTSKPIVLTNVGDFNYYLTDKINVIFSKPGNYKDFADKILWVLDNYQIARLIGLNGKKTALEKFNYAIEANKIFRIIKINSNLS